MRDVNFEKCVKVIEVAETISLEEAISHFGMQVHRELLALGSVIHENHIFTLSDDISTALKNTENQVYNRRLPYPALFISANLQHGDNLLWGIFLHETFNTPEGEKQWVENQHKLDDYNLKFMDFIESYGEDPMQVLSNPLKRFRLQSSFDNTEIGHRLYGLINWKLDLKKFSTEPTGIKYHALGYDVTDNRLVHVFDGISSHPERENRIKKYRDTMAEKASSGYYPPFAIVNGDKLHQTIELFVCSVLDFINSPRAIIGVGDSINYTTRKRRYSLPSHTISVSKSVRQRLREYVRAETSLEFTHQFWVRGHYMHFWDKKRYHTLYSLKEQMLSEGGYQHDLQWDVVKKWVLPFKKGSGELVEKDYIIKKPKQDGHGN